MYSNAQITREFVEKNLTKLPFDEVVDYVKEALKRETNLEHETNTWREILSVFDYQDFIKTSEEKTFFDSLNDSFITFRKSLSLCDNPKKVLWSISEKSEMGREIKNEDNKRITTLYRKIDKSNILGVFPETGEIIYLAA